MIISFDKVVSAALDKVDDCIQERDYENARRWFDNACHLYFQHPTGNQSLEFRKADLYRTLYER